LWIMPRFVQNTTHSAQNQTDDRFYVIKKVGRRLGRGVKEWVLVSVVATLATAPLVAHYFQVVSILGVLVNAVAIPLVLGVALPLGEAAVLAQSLSLTSVAEILLHLGRWPLWLGYEIIEQASRLPGAAVVIPTPTWLQIFAYYGIMAGIFASRRTLLTWAGASLAGLAMAASVALPLLYHPREAEITVLDTHGGLAGIVVTPAGQRLVITAPAPYWPRRQSAAPGPLPSYLHWRQWRRLDQVLALLLSQENASDVLLLAQQFRVGTIKYGSLGVQGPAYWELWNYLGDRGQTPRSLSRDLSSITVDEVTLSYFNLGKDSGIGLALAWGSKAALILTPLRGSGGGALVLPSVSEQVEVMILPLDLRKNELSATLVKHYQPKQLVLYGRSRRFRSSEAVPSSLPSYLTRDGAVSVYFGGSTTRVKQYKP